MSKGFLLASVWGCSHGPVKSLSDKSRHKAQRQLSRTLKHSLSVLLSNCHSHFPLSVLYLHWL